MRGYGEKKPLPFWAKCLILIAVEGIVAVLILLSRDTFAGDLSAEDLYKNLTDAFFVPGVLVTCFALLVLVAGEGSFDAITWGLTAGFRALIPGGRLGKFEKYGDYVMRKRGERKKGGSGVMFVSGGVMLLASMICMIIYFQVTK